MSSTIKDTHILDAALHTIAQRGYKGATTKHIAQQAGINEVTLFRRFGSKKQLLFAAMKHELERFSALGIEYTGDLEFDLVQIVQFYHELMYKRGQTITAIMTEVPRQPDLQEVMDIPQGIIHKVNELFERYQREGKLTEEPPMQLFLSLIGPLLAGAMIELIHPHTSAVSFEPTEHVRHFLQGRNVQNE